MATERRAGARRGDGSSRRCRPHPAASASRRPARPWQLPAARRRSSTWPATINCERAEHVGIVSSSRNSTGSRMVAAPRSLSRPAASAVPRGFAPKIGERIEVGSPCPRRRRAKTSRAWTWSWARRARRRQRRRAHQGVAHPEERPLVAHEAGELGGHHHLGRRDSRPRRACAGGRDAAPTGCSRRGGGCGESPAAARG